MTKSKIAKLVFLAVIVLLALFVATSAFNGYRRQHVVFDSHKWQSDVNSRFDMPEQAKPGMTEKQVRQLYGKPELEVPSRQDPTVKTFCYRMPEAGQKSVYYIVIENGVVSKTQLDDSADLDYDEIEKHLKQLPLKTPDSK